MDPDAERAIKMVQRAVLKTEPVRKTTRQLKNFVKKKVDPPKWAITATAIGISAATSGRINTRRIKRLGISGETWTVRPDVELNLREGSTSGTINLDLNF